MSLLPVIIKAFRTYIFQKFSPPLSNKCYSQSLKKNECQPVWVFSPKIKKVYYKKRTHSAYYTPNEISFVVQGTL